MKTDSENPSGKTQPLLLWLLLQKFIWMDQALQENRAAAGGVKLSRAESQVMLLVAVGARRPTEVAKELGMSRQAANVTINLLKDRGLIETRPDPDDKRCKIIVFAESGQSTRDDAVEILNRMERELQRRLGKKAMEKLIESLSADWGPSPLFDKTGWAGKD